MTGVPCLSTRSPRQGRFHKFLVPSVAPTSEKIRVLTVEYKYGRTTRLGKGIDCSHYVVKIYVNKSHSIERCS